MTDQGLLVEESRTNVALWSEDFNQSYWVKNNQTVTAGAHQSPSGATDASKITSTANSSSLLFTATLDASTEYTLTFYVKDISAGTSLRAVVYDTATSTEILSQNYSSGISSTGWTRLEFTFTTNGNNDYQIRPIVDLNNGEELYLWGVQLEQASFPTSYTPTNGAAVTRAADIIQFSDLSWMNWTAGTFLSELVNYGKNSDGEMQRIIWGNAPSYYINLYNGTSVVTYSDTIAVLSGGSIVLGETSKIALAWSSTGRSLTSTGNTLTSDANIISLTSTALYYGSRLSDFINGFGKTIVFWPQRKSDTELQELTS